LIQNGMNSLITVLNKRISEANSVPLGLGG
jgi:hypothetical protein